MQREARIGQVENGWTVEYWVISQGWRTRIFTDLDEALEFMRKVVG